MSEAVQSPRKVAVIGLGSMGYGIAVSVLRSGHMVWGVDVDAKRVDKFRSDGGQPSEITGAACELDAVVVVVLNAEQTQDVMFGDGGIVASLKPGAVVLACTTVSPSFAGDMAARCAEAGVLYLDAPISGGSVKAANGQLSIMASGSADAFAAARPILDSTAEIVFELGDEPGTGSAMKAVNQLLAGVHIATMAEALTFGMTQGVTPEKFVEVISKCAGTSWMLENRAPHIVSGDYTPHSSVNIWPKDLGIVLDIAKSVRFDAPITTAALRQFMTAAEMGHGREDDAAVAKVYARNAGLTLPGEE
ncbi:MAG: NAD(P)-dependent oxidoreductase [Hyphomicrobiales bacterium]|nr:NAD(P)-dependent oxidoreductase [Hyphomicrobiales bacterium]